MFVQESEHYVYKAKGFNQTRYYLSFKSLKNTGFIDHILTIKDIERHQSIKLEIIEDD